MAPLIPTRSTSAPTTILHLLRRQTLVPLPPYYPYITSSLSPGTIIGIVVGSVAGFLLLLWVIYTCIQGGTFGASEMATSVVSTRQRAKVITRERSERSERVLMRERSRSPRRDTSVRRETVREVREVPIPVVVEPPAPEVERVGVVIEEHRERRSSRVRPEDDEVVVIEEHSPPPRRKKKRSSERRDEGGYRIVDPAAYAGGNPEEEIRRSRRSRRMSGGRSAR